MFLAYNSWILWYGKLECLYNDKLDEVIFLHNLLKEILECILISKGNVDTNIPVQSNSFNFF